MATSWITGVCAQQNRLEWTVLRRVKDAWEIADQGSAELPASAGAAEGVGGVDILVVQIKRLSQLRCLHCV